MNEVQVLIPKPQFSVVLRHNFKLDSHFTRQRKREQAGLGESYISKVKSLEFFSDQKLMTFPTVNAITQICNQSILADYQGQTRVDR